MKLWFLLIALTLSEYIGHGDTMANNPEVTVTPIANIFTLGLDGEFNLCSSSEVKLGMTGHDILNPILTSLDPAHSLIGIYGTYFEDGTKTLHCQFFDPDTGRFDFDSVDLGKLHLIPSEELTSTNFLYSHSEGGKLYLIGRSIRSFWSLRNSVLEGNILNPQAITFASNDGRICVFSSSKYFPSGEFGYYLIDSSSGQILKQGYVHSGLAPIRGLSEIIWLSRNVVLHIRNNAARTELTLLNTDTGRCADWSVISKALAIPAGTEPTLAFSVFQSRGAFVSFDYNRKIHTDIIKISKLLSLVQ